MIRRSAKGEDWDVRSFYERDWGGLQPEADMMSALVEYLEGLDDSIEAYVWTSHLSY